MLKQTLSLFLLLTIFGFCQGNLSKFWSIVWHQTLPKPLNQEQFHEIVLRFKENFLNFEHDLDNMSKEMSEHHKNNTGR